jgi:hypothetical protein
MQKVGRKQIRKLAFSEPMQRLVARGETFDLMHVLGVSSREHAYSNILAFVLDPNEAHCFGAGPLVEFLRALETAAEGELLPFASLLGSDVGWVRVRREYKGIDLLIELADHRTAIAIENKIYAGEQQAQVARYQATVTREYPQWTRCLVFLTPFGTPPETHDESSDVSVVNMRYRTIAALLDHASAGNTAGSANFAQAVAANIRHQILEDHPMEDDIHALWGDPAFAAALSEVVRHAPHLMTVKEEFVEKVTAWAARDRGLNVSQETLYPIRGEPYELALRFAEWDTLGLPVTIKFYWHQNTEYWNNPDCQPGIRAFIWWEDFDANKQNFLDLQKSGGEKISRDFAPITGWTGWRRFLAEDDYPQESLVPFRPKGFVDELVRRAMDVIVEVDEIIRGGRA